MSRLFPNPFSICIKAPRADGDGEPQPTPVNTTSRRSTMAAPADMPLNRPAFNVPAGNIERFRPKRGNGLDALQRSNSEGRQLETNRALENVSTQAAGTGFQPHPPVQTSGHLTSSSTSLSAEPPRPGATPEVASTSQEQAGPNAGHAKRIRDPMKSLRKAGTGIKHIATACFLGPGHSQNASKPVPGRERPLPQPNAEVAGPGQGQVPQPLPSSSGQSAASAGVDRGPSFGELTGIRPGQNTTPALPTGEAGTDASSPKSRSTAQKVGRTLKHFAADWFVPARSYPFNKNRSPRREALPQRPAAPIPTPGRDETRGAGPLPPHVPSTDSGRPTHFASGGDTGIPPDTHRSAIASPRTQSVVPPLTIGRSASWPPAESRRTEAGPPGSQAGTGMPRSPDVLTVGGEIQPAAAVRHVPASSQMGGVATNNLPRVVPPATGVVIESPATSPRASHARQEMLGSSSAEGESSAGNGESLDIVAANPLTRRSSNREVQLESQVIQLAGPSLSRSPSIESLPERTSVPGGAIGPTQPIAASGHAPVPEMAQDDSDEESVYFTPQESPTHDQVASEIQLTPPHSPVRSTGTMDGSPGTPAALPGPSRPMLDATPSQPPLQRGASLPTPGTQRAEGSTTQAHTHTERTADAHAQALNIESAHEPNVLSRAAETVLKTGQKIAATTWKHVDARRLLTVGDDREMIDRLRAGDPETERKSLTSLREQVAELKQELQQAVPDSDATDPANQKILKHFGDHIDHLDSVLRGLEKDRPWAVRAAIYGAMNVALPAMPIAVALKSGQGKFFAELAGMYGKTALMALGAIRSPTAADRHAIKDHFMQRHFLTLIQTAFHVVPSFDDRLKHLNQGAILNITAATLTTLTGIAAFLHEDIGRSVKNRIWNSPNPTLKNAWDNLSPADSANFKRVLTNIEEAASKTYEDISAETWKFKEEEGKTISPYTSTQLKFVTDALLNITRDVKELRDPEQAAPANADNPQWRAKLALALLNVTIGSAVTVLMIPDWIGVGGNAGDTLVTSGIQFKGALQGDVSREDALDSFRSWSGLSVLMLGLLALNKAKGDFIDKGGATGVAVGATSLAILNAVLPGPIGHFLGSGIEKLMNMKSADFLAFTTRIGQGALDLFQQRAEATAPPASSVRIEELDVAGPQPATQPTVG